MSSLKEGYKILLYMPNTDWLTQCWVLDGIKALVNIRPEFREEMISFLNEFHSEKEEIRLKIYEIKNYNDIIEDKFDVYNADF